MTRTQIARQTIHEFVRTTRLRRRLWFTIASLTTHGLFVGVALYLLDWAWPAFHPTALWIGLGWLVLVLAWHLLHPGLSLRVADGTLGLQDRLLTWWSVRDRDADAAIEWLEDDLSRWLRDLPPEARTQLWRRPVRRLLWALPLLFVVWVIGPIGRQFLLPSPVGVTRPADAGPVAKNTDEIGESKVADRPDSKSKQPQKPQPKQPDPKRPPRDDPGNQPPPKPVQLLPGAEEFVIPPFISEGDGRLQKTRIAVLQDGGADQRTGSGGGTAARTAEDSRQERAREYRRAEERALRSRHVPVRERGFVRRYFVELLRDPASRRVPKQ